MSLLKQFKLLSNYNQLMNQRIFDAVAKLPDEKIQEDKGAFFKSLHGTLNHILVGDIIWLQRFATHPVSQKSLAAIIIFEKPTSLNSILYANFNDLKAQREKIDQLIIEWIDALTEEDLNSTINYENMNGIPFTKDYASLINHLFLHQVHHRGQATTLLSQFNINFGDTDLIEII